MSIQKTMEKYAELHKALTGFKEANRNVFELQQEMEKAISEVEDEIKAAARGSKEDALHAGVKVTVIRKFKKSYDWKLLSEKTQELLMKKEAVRFEVNKDAFEELVHNEEISMKERAEAFKEEEMSTSVTVKMIEKK